MIDKLILVVSNSPNAIIPTNEWRDKASGTILCPECRKMNPSWYPKPVDITLWEYPKGTIGGGSAFAAVTIYHRDFVNQIKNYLRDIIIGKCFDKDGNLIDDCVTIYSTNPIMKRAGRNTEYRICKTCNSIGFKLWHGKWYVLRSYLTDAKVYVDNSSFIYLAEDLASSLDFSPWPDADLDVIPIRDKPTDGQHLPCDPPGLW